MTDFIAVNEPLLDGNEKKYLMECIETGWVSSEGPFVRAFEEKMAAYLGRKHGISICNGTAALELALAALQLPEGSEVILPALTIISCAAAVIRNNLSPVLVDSDPATWNMDVREIEKKISPRTGAIMAVHTYGLPVDMGPLLSLAGHYGLQVVEDAAEAIGQTCEGKACGSFGAISTLSFYPNKHVTTGEGGMVLTDDPYLAERSGSLRNLCFKPGKRFVHDELGYNFRMSNLQAAVGLAQYERLGDFVERKQAMGRYYTEGLKHLEAIELPLPSTCYSDNIYWVYGIVVKDSCSLEAEGMMRELAGLGIGTRPFFYPMHQQPVFRKKGLFVDEHYPVAEKLSRRGFYIPSGLALTFSQMDRVIDAICAIIKRG